MLRGHNVTAKVYTERLEREAEREQMLNPKRRGNPSLGTTKEKVIVGFIMLIPLSVFLYFI